MWTSRITRSVVTAVAVLAATGCGPALYHGFQQTRTYEFERRASVIVRSDPAGATITTSSGMVLGQAPLIVEDRVRVRRSRRSHKMWLTALGCIIDAGVFAAAVNDSHLSGKLRDAVFIVGISAFLLDMDIYFRSTVAHEDEQVIPRTLELVARWDGLADARVQLALPATRAATLRLPRTYTFDEALTLWARANRPPLTGESLYRIGNYYRTLALQGVHGAKERALEHLSLYLQHHAAAEHADAVRGALEELRGLRGRAR